MIGHGQTIVKMPSNDVAGPLDVAADWLAGNIYWSEVEHVRGQGGNGRIVMAKDDGRYKRTIVKNNLEIPTSVAVDPEHGLLFWADAGNNPKIEKSWMDGTQRRTIVDTNIGHPEAITIDFAMDHTLYWVDSKLGTINIMDHNGLKRHVINSNVRKPVGLDIFESNMFWVNHEDNSLMKQDKFGRGVPVTLAKNLPNPRLVPSNEWGFERHWDMITYISTWGHGDIGTWGHEDMGTCTTTSKQIEFFHYRGDKASNTPANPKPLSVSFG